MNNKKDETTYYIVKSDVLPEVFEKVLNTKKLLKNEKVKTINEAVKITGISRSVFYKYKDAVDIYRPSHDSEIVNIQCLLEDKQGVLSKVLSVFALSGGDILTINQNIPIDGYASVIISFRTNNMKYTNEKLIGKLLTQDGVVKAKLIAGGMVK